MEHNTKGLEQELARMEREVWQELAKDKMPVTEKYIRKYGSTDGEANEEEMDELMKAFGVSKHYTYMASQDAIPKRGGVPRTIINFVVESKLIGC